MSTRGRGRSGQRDVLSNQEREKVAMVATLLAFVATVQ